MTLNTWLSKFRERIGLVLIISYYYLDVIIAPHEMSGMLLSY
ncbi:hypothetical protein [Erysipelothrix piscisicarius]